MTKQVGGILIVGAGPAGLSAAKAAARMGTPVTILEKENLPGGLIRSAFLDTIRGMASCAAQTELSSGSVSAFERQLIPGENFLQWIHSALADERIELITGAYVYSVKMKNAVIRRVDAATCAGKLEFFPDMVIDATGMGQIAALSGCAMMPGDLETGLAAAPQIRLRLRGADMRAFLSRGRGVHTFTDGVFASCTAQPGFYGEVIVTFTRRESLRGDRTIAETAALQAHFDEDLRLAQKLLQENVAGLADAIIVNHSPGYLFPESAHPKGAHILEKEELEKGGLFSDWAVSHMIGQDEAGNRAHFRLPYGSMVTPDIKNLLLCGQSLSVSHEAAAYLRGLTIAMASGQAAGVAAVLSLLEEKKVRNLDVTLLQECLLRTGMAAPMEKEEQ